MHPSTRLLLSMFVVATAVMHMTPASAQVSVKGIIREILPDQRPIENVEVSNSSEKRILQVNIEMAEEIRHDDGSKTQKPTDDFLVAPKTMVLRPNETKQARLVLRKPPGDEERYYRARFKPKTPDPIRMKALELTKAEQTEQDKLKAGISMIGTMGMFITVAPAEPEPKLTWQRTSDAVVFNNEGNTTIVMRPRKEFCPEGKESCMDLPRHRLFPGDTWRFEYPADLPLVYYYTMYDNTQKAVIGAVE